MKNAFPSKVMCNTSLGKAAKNICFVDASTWRGWGVDYTYARQANDDTHDTLRIADN